MRTTTRIEHRPAFCPECGRPTSGEHSDGPFQFQVIPQVCLIADVCRVLRISERQFHYLMARKQLALVELTRIDRVRRFTGRSVVRQIESWVGSRVVARP